VFPTLQSFPWGQRSEKNVVQWFERTFLQVSGHYGCHDFRHYIHSAEWYSWNWADIPKLNAIFEVVVMVVIVVVVVVIVVAVLLWLWLMK